MPLHDTPISGLLIVEPKVIKDERGYFFESYNKQEFKAAGFDVDFVQDNQSSSKYGVLRGLHFQQEPYAQAKLVRVISGSVWDIALDLRSNSSTFGQSFAIELSSENFLQLFIPRGFAHGFVVTSEEAVFAYKCDNYYSKEHDTGIYFADPDLNIDWKLPEKDLILSEKDKNLPLLKNLISGF